MPWTITGIVGSVLAMGYLILKYYPDWRRRHEKRAGEKDIASFGQEILDGDDVGLGVRLSDEYDRLRSQEGGDTAKR